MGMKISTGLAKAMLDAGSLIDNLDGMKLKIYSGTEPATADSSIGSAVLLCTLTDADGGDPLLFESDAVNNVLEKNAAQVWSGTNVASGTASFCRLELTSDTGGSSSSEIRVQGDVGTAGRFLNLSSVVLTAAAVQVVDYLSITMPTQ